MKPLYGSAARRLQLPPLFLLGSAPPGPSARGPSRSRPPSVSLSRPRTLAAWRSLLRVELLQTVPHGRLAGPGALALLEEARDVLHDGRKAQDGRTTEKSATPRWPPEALTHSGSAHSRPAYTSGITPRGACRERRRRPWAPAGCQGNRASVLWAKLSPGLCAFPRCWPCH